MQAAELRKIVRFGLLGAVGCLAGALIGEPFLWLALPSASVGGAPSLVASTGAPPPPPEFKERLDAANARTGDVQISLIWNNRHDLDLHCYDPQTGEDIFFKNRRSRTGGWLDVDSNAGCEDDVRDKPVENIVWEKGTAPQGKYRVYVHFFVPCPKEQRNDPESKGFATPYQVSILADGERKQFDGTLRYTPEQRGLVFVHEFTLGPKLRLSAPPEVKVHKGGSIRVPVRLQRSSINGPVTVTGSNLPAGVTASSITLKDGETDGTIELTAKDGDGTVPIQIVATSGDTTSSAAVSLNVGSGAGWSWWLIVVTGIWTALLAAGLTAALVVGQNLYLGRSWLTGGLLLAAGGSAAAGIASGAIGQALLFVFAAVSLASVGFIAGWLLLGTLLGGGVSFFIPNLDVRKAAIAGLVGGGIAAIGFLILSLLADLLGRVGGAVVLGFCIGLMVALVEVAFRRAWLEVRYGGGEVITVNLGPEPIKVGGDSRMCTVWARGAAPVALRYWIRDGKVICHETDSGEQTVGNGDQRRAGAVEVIVRTGAGEPVAAPAAKPPAARPVSPPTPVAQPISPPVPVAVPVAPPVPVVQAAPPMPKPVPPPAPQLPTAPVPAAVASTDTDACPTPGCGRKASGLPGKRYCIVCDHYF